MNLVVRLTVVVALLAFAGGAAWQEVSARRAGKNKEFQFAVTAYQRGCMVAGVLNFAAGGAAVVAIFACGTDNGLWMAELLVLGLPVFGLALATPRVGALRKLHHRPALPSVRV